MARENSGWGYDRIGGGRANFGHEISDQTVGNVLRRHGIAPARKRSQTTAWKDFIDSHIAVLAGMDCVLSARLHKESLGYFSGK